MVSKIEECPYKNIYIENHNVSSFGSSRLENLIKNQPKKRGTKTTTVLIEIVLGSTWNLLRVWRDKKGLRAHLLSESPILQLSSLVPPFGLLLVPLLSLPPE